MPSGQEAEYADLPFGNFSLAEYPNIRASVGSISRRLVETGWVTESGQLNREHRDLMSINPHVAGMRGVGAELSRRGTSLDAASDELVLEIYEGAYGEGSYAEAKFNSVLAPQLSHQLQQQLLNEQLVRDLTPRINAAFRRDLPLPLVDLYDKELRDAAKATARVAARQARKGFWRGYRDRRSFGEGYVSMADDLMSAFADPAFTDKIAAAIQKRLVFDEATGYGVKVSDESLAWLVNDHCLPAVKRVALERDSGGGLRLEPKVIPSSARFVAEEGQIFLEVGRQGGPALLGLTAPAQRYSAYVDPEVAADVVRERMENFLVQEANLETTAAADVAGDFLSNLTSNPAYTVALNAAPDFLKPVVKRLFGKKLGWVKKLESYTTPHGLDKQVRTRLGDLTRWSLAELDLGFTKEEYFDRLGKRHYRNAFSPLTWLYRRQVGPARLAVHLKNVFGGGALGMGAAFLTPGGLAVKLASFAITSIGAPILANRVERWRADQAERLAKKFIAQDSLGTKVRATFRDTLEREGLLPLLQRKKRKRKKKNQWEGDYSGTLVWVLKYLGKYAAAAIGLGVRHFLATSGFTDRWLAIERAGGLGGGALKGVRLTLKYGPVAITSLFKGGLTGGIAGYLGSGGNPWVTGASAFLGTGWKAVSLLAEQGVLPGLTRTLPISEAQVNWANAPLKGIGLGSVIGWFLGGPAGARIGAILGGFTNYAWGIISPYLQEFTGIFKQLLSLRAGAFLGKHPTLAKVLSPLKYWKGLALGFGFGYGAGVLFGWPTWARWLAGLGGSALFGGAQKVISAIGARLQKIPWFKGRFKLGGKFGAILNVITRSLALWRLPRNIKAAWQRSFGNKGLSFGQQLKGFLGGFFKLQGAFDTWLVAEFFTGIGVGIKKLIGNWPLVQSAWAEGAWAGIKEFFGGLWGVLKEGFLSFRIFQTVAKFISNIARELWAGLAAAGTLVVQSAIWSLIIGVLCVALIITVVGASIYMAYQGLLPPGESELVEVYKQADLDTANNLIRYTITVRNISNQDVTIRDVEDTPQVYLEDCALDPLDVGDGSPGYGILWYSDLSGSVQQYPNMNWFPARRQPQFVTELGVGESVSFTFEIRDLTSENATYRNEVLVTAIGDLNATAFAAVNTDIGTGGCKAKFQAPCGCPLGSTDIGGNFVENLSLCSNITQGCRQLPTHQNLEAVDIGAVRGTPIQAMISGEVTRWAFSLVNNPPNGDWNNAFGDQRDWGVVVEIENSEYRILYAHLLKEAYPPGAPATCDDLSPSGGLSCRWDVQKGDIIGYVDNTGFSSADHLHYEIFVKHPRIGVNEVRRCPIEFINQSTPECAGQ